MWLPPGQWHDAFTGKVYGGGRNISVSGVGVSTMPLFHRAGGVVITAANPGDTITEIDWDRLVLHVWPTRHVFGGSDPRAAAAAIAHVTRPMVTRLLHEPSDLVQVLPPTVVTKTEKNIEVNNGTMEVSGFLADTTVKNDLVSFVLEGGPVSDVLFKMRLWDPAMATPAP